MEGLNVNEVGDWLIEEGFSLEVVDAFSEQEMDGTAISQAFGTCPGPDCLKEVICKPYGTRVKVYTAIKSYLEKDIKLREEAPTVLSSKPCNISFPVETSSSISERTLIISEENSCKGSKSLQGSESKGSTQVVPIIRTPKQQKVPNPFPIPLFRGSTESNLAVGKLGESDRRYMVRVLGTTLCGHVQVPVMTDCQVVAESLLKKYSFLKECNSWKQYLYTKCQNINRKQHNDDAPTPKRLKLEPQKHAYAALTMDCEDEVSSQRNTDLLKKEISKSKPKPDVVKELIKRTMQSRRDMVMGSTRPEDILSEYPHLRKASYICYEFDLIVGLPNSYDTYTDTWISWKEAILENSTSSTNRPKMLQLALRDKDSDDPEADTLTAFRCLAYFMVPKSRKKVGTTAGGAPHTNEPMDIPHILVDAKRGTPPNEIINKETNQPHLLRLVDEELPSQYFIAVEQVLHVEVPSIMKGVFLLLALHYVYDIEYHPRLKDFFHFLEDKLLGIPAPSSEKKSTT